MSKVREQSSSRSDSRLLKIKDKQGNRSLSREVSNGKVTRIIISKIGVRKFLKIKPTIQRVDNKMIVHW